ncbi:Uncharacterized protein Fot_14548 [Forsythia ovata]|uniref:Uncharacterized protein n=1 Tax=Forsythia ovata TaxID=205694 RepID=A0ABD1WA67_9LAMI
MTARHRSHLSENHLARAFILVQDQNRLCEELSATTEKYVAEVEEYKKKEYLANFRDSDERKQIFEDGKHAEGTELLELIKNELLDINFDFIYEEGKRASLAFLPETNNNEIVAEPASSEAVVEPTTGTLPSQDVDSTIFENLQDL